MYSGYKYSDYFIEDNSDGLRIRDSDSRNSIGCNIGPYLTLRGPTAFFVRPTLKIIGVEPNELTDGRWKPRVYEPLRRFIDIKIKNTGSEPAVDCETKLCLLKQLDDCHALSTEDKLLTWDTGHTKTTISAKYGQAKFHLAFSQDLLAEHAEKIEPVYCGIKKQKTRFQSWVGTLPALKSPHERDQDGMCNGKFKAHVEIYTVTGDRVYTDFIISVGDNWQSLNATESKCDCINQSLYSKIRNRIFLFAPEL